MISNDKVSVNGNRNSNKNRIKIVCLIIVIIGIGGGLLSNFNGFFIIGTIIYVLALLALLVCGLYINTDSRKRKIQANKIGDK